MLTSCPIAFAGDAMELIEYAELYTKGLPPVAGGALDQTHYFLTASRFIRAEQVHWRERSNG